MTSMRIGRNTAEKILIGFIAAELILGGSGRLIAAGPISLRIIILACLLAYNGYLLYKKKLTACTSNIILISILFYFTGILLFSVMVNNTANAINSFTGYIVIAVCPAFIYLFEKNNGLIDVLKKTIYVSTIALSFITLALWAFSIVSLGTIAPILNRFQYGALAYVGPIPRLFLKGSIFICCALFFSVTDYIEQHKFRSIIQSGLYLLAITVTFTTSLYVFTACILLLVVYYNYGRMHFIKALIMVVVLAIVGVALLYYLGIFDVFRNRFSGDYNMSYKGIQCIRVLQESTQSPLFGKGFGYPIKIDYGYLIVNAYSFEIMWLQLLLDTGLIGFVLFSGHVLLTLYELHMQYNRTGNSFYRSLEFSLIMFCLVSFTNPFMNNAIGLLFYALCVGAAHAPEGKNGVINES